MSEKNAYAISEKIAQALIKDGKTEGYDLEAGLFGLEFSKLVRELAALEAENAELSEKLSKSEEARRSAQIYLDDAKERCKNEFQKLRHELSGCINKVSDLEKDKQRLDWLQQQKHFDANLQKDGCHKIYALKQAQEFAGRTLREAIDNAIKEETT